MLPGLVFCGEGILMCGLGILDRDKHIVSHSAFWSIPDWKPSQLALLLVSLYMQQHFWIHNYLIFTLELANCIKLVWIHFL